MLLPLLCHISGSFPSAGGASGPFWATAIGSPFSYATLSLCRVLALLLGFVCCLTVPLLGWLNPGWSVLPYNPHFGDGCQLCPVAGTAGSPCFVSTTFRSPTSVGFCLDGTSSASRPVVLCATHVSLCITSPSHTLWPELLLVWVVLVCPVVLSRPSAWRLHSFSSMISTLTIDY